MRTSTSAGPAAGPHARGAPRLFFTDVQSGPRRGGQSDLVTFLTLYGEGFGAKRGRSTVTVGGGKVARYVIWGQDNARARSMDMIVVQLGRTAASGRVVVRVGGRVSNPLPFTVRPGRIFFVAATGHDRAAGSFRSPWRTISKAENAMRPGDIVYVLDGVAETTEENHGAVVSVETSGASGSPKAIVGYPGSTATIGSTALEFGIRVPNTEGTRSSDWVLANLDLRGRVQAVDVGGFGSSRWRVVGNDISCPIGNGQTGCFAAALASEIAFLGNEVHGISVRSGQAEKQYHAVYFTTDTNHVEIGWNHIHDNLTCRALQFHSSPLDGKTGHNQYDLSVHDNLIHGDPCDGIDLATVDPSKGPVRVFNNVIFDVGRGPSPADGDANYSCIFVAGGTNTGHDGTGSVEIFNNTLYDCGARGRKAGALGDEGAFGRGPGSPGLVMRLRSNAVYVLSGERYFSRSSNTALVRGTKNLWFGGAAPPGFLVGNVTADPLFADVAQADFRLSAGSPAVDAGADLPAEVDFLGVKRPQRDGVDIGAFELPAAPS